MLLFALLCATLWVAWRVYAVFAYRPRRLAGATVVVSGACSEVGRRLCLQFYARGARVVAWDYSRIKLQELQAEVLRVAAATTPVAAAGIEDGFTIAAVDASSRVQVQRAAKEINGAVDIIINAAHTCPSKPLHDRADDSIDRIFQTNLVSPLLVVRQLLPLLFKANGSDGAAQYTHRRRDDYAQVVNIVCGAGSYTVAAQSPEYAASQWGMVGLHYSLRAWLAQERALFAQSSQEGKDEAQRARAKTNASRGEKQQQQQQQDAREVRTTLICLNDIQNGVPTALNSMLAPASAMLGGTASPSSTSSGLGAAERTNGAAAASDGGMRTARAAPTSSSNSPSRDGYTSAVQRRSAELDRAVASCIGAISRGQARYCHSASWVTTVLFPVAMACPLPWAEPLLRWLQRSPASAAALDA